MIHRVQMTQLTGLAQCSRCWQVDPPEVLIGQRCYADYDQLDYERDGIVHDQVITRIWPAAVLVMVGIVLLIAANTLGWSF